MIANAVDSAAETRTFTHKSSILDAACSKDYRGRVMMSARAR
jgi:hypothetical protein